jgi:ABC-type multidrug transport system ATPase subunit
LDKIILNQVAKRFNHEWVFRDFNFTFEKNNAYVILGSNGSGKSTLLQIISSFLTPTKGSVSYFHQNNKLSEDVIYSRISFATPYMELPEEFTLSEVIDFHLHFKKFHSSISKTEFLRLCQLSEAINKPVKNFSSGMKQRLKLGLAILSDVDAIFLDEPSSNLDQNGISIYETLISNYSAEKIMLVCSNHVQREYSFCNHTISIEDFKNKIA